MNNLLEDLNRRYATKKFDSSKKVSEENLGILLESLRLSASSFGLQPWKFLVIRNQNIKNELYKFSWNQSQITDCSDLIILCAKEDMSGEYIKEYINDISSTRSQNSEELMSYYYDFILGFIKDKSKNRISDWNSRQVYVALGFLLVACSNLRIDSCPMEGFLKDDYMRILGLEGSGYVPVVVCPIGYRSDEDQNSKNKKVRFDIKKIVEFID